MYIEKIKRTGIMPVIKLAETENSEKLATALMKGGVDIAEVTFRAKGAEEVIRKMVSNQPDMIVGAGTVITLDQAQKAVEAGAKFLVSPGLDEEVVKWSIDNGILVLPGCATPTEIMKAIKLGINVVKFFPAGQFGGIKTIKALGGPFASVEFVPTGGITIDNLAEYVKNPKVIACGGSFVVSDKLLKEENFEEITKLCIKARKIIDESRKEK